MSVVFGMWVLGSACLVLGYFLGRLHKPKVRNVVNWNAPVVTGRTRRRLGREIAGAVNRNQFLTSKGSEP